MSSNLNKLEAHQIISCDSFALTCSNTGMPLQALPTASQQAVYYQGNYLRRMDASPMLPHLQTLLCALSSLSHTSWISTTTSINWHTMTHSQPAGKCRDGSRRSSYMSWCCGSRDTNGHLRKAIKMDRAADNWFILFCTFGVAVSAWKKSIL